MTCNKMGRWSILPQQRYNNFDSPRRATYILPMTPAASVAQVAMMQNRQLMSQADYKNNIEYAVGDANNKANNAIKMASEMQQEQMDIWQSILTNQGVMAFIIAIIIIIFIFFMRR